MSRLIDADKLIEELNKNSIFRTVTNAEGKSAIEIIEQQPTAYDVDKVVSKMETEIEENQDASLSEYRVGLSKAIEMVKAGGIDD